MIYAYDIEVFMNYFLVCFHNDKESISFEIDDMDELCDFLSNKELILVGYNNFSYDDVILKHIMNCDGIISTKEIFELSCLIIGSRRASQEVFKLQYAPTPWKYSIDIFQFMNKRGSLKEWECREQMDVVMESPVDFTKPLSKKDIPQTIAYCECDVKATWHLFQKYKHLAILREKLKNSYGLSNRVFVVGEAGLAQQVIMAMHTARTGEAASVVKQRGQSNFDNKQESWPLSEIISPRVFYQYQYSVKFLEEFKESTLTACDPHRTKWELDSEWQLPIKFGSAEYQLGVGGLHSIDEPAAFYSDEKYLIVDLDVTSYYPSIMIEENLFPKQLGPTFVVDFRKIRDSRVAAKKKQQEAEKSGDEKTAKDQKNDNEALKIVINSTFGKLNDRYSPFRSIPNALRVTINGQLFLLMLIEIIENQCGATIISSNTDGVTFKIPRYMLPNLDKSMELWTKRTCHQLERTDYSCYIRRDVNAYVAMTVDGKLKAKGALTAYPLTGKWDNIAAIKAAQEYLTKGIDPRKSLKKHKNPKDFLYYQMVKNGGSIYHGDKKIGKLARWYVAKSGDTITRMNPNGTTAKIPNGANAQLALDVSDWEVFGIPDDLDTDFYVEEAWNIIQSTGVKQ